MLSIRFDSKTEWWVSGTTFERLFKAGMKDGLLSAELENWLHVADANGGLDIPQIPPAEAAKLMAGIRSAAEREVQRLSDAAAATEDGSYKVSLQKLLDLQKADSSIQ